MYAIAFDLDTENLKRHYHNQSWENAYADVGRALARFGFHRQQGSVYFGDDNVTPVTCVLAVQAASGQHPWLKYCVNDIRMLRIEENNDLYPALGDVGLPFDSPPRQPEQENPSSSG
jgi:virulence-associated protein VapD